MYTSSWDVPAGSGGLVRCSKLLLIRIFEWMDCIKTGVKIHTCSCRLVVVNSLVACEGGSSPPLTEAFRSAVQLPALAPGFDLDLDH